MSHKHNKFEDFLESFIFSSRWILAPFYIALVIALGALGLKFAQHFFHFLSDLWHMSETDTLLNLLALIDMTLLANLMILVIFSGYENFVSVIGVAQESPDRPKWMGDVDFSSLKLKLIGSLVALSSISLLGAFLNIRNWTHEQLAWMIGIHMTFVISGLIFAMSEKIGHSKSKDCEDEH